MNAQHEKEDEQNMQQRHQRRGGAARQVFAAQLLGAKGAGAGAQKWVRQDNFAGQKSQSVKRFPATPPYRSAGGTKTGAVSSNGGKPAKMLTRP